MVREWYRDFSTLGNTFFNTFFILDENVVTTTRTTYNMLNALADTGGFASVITLVFTVLSMRVQKILFFLTIAQ
jgi:hypothetical protein